MEVLKAILAALVGLLVILPALRGQSPPCWGRWQLSSCVRCACWAERAGL